MPAKTRTLRWIAELRKGSFDRRGSAAVEFALIAFPLIFMIFCCLELALIVLLSVTLDNATDLAARQIRTGILTQSNSTAASFRQKICANMSWLSGSCAGSLQVDVQTYDSFAQVPKTDLIKNGQFDSANFAYVIGKGSKIQMVRAYYEWPMFTPFLQAGMTTLSNKNAVITTKVVFRNEPF
ncbi:MULTISPECIES: TadE/TadG family type IV pilus assembly protein [Asticcacaulis]|uniref:TadE/TadG family type IV pilus assembly protein n=1 Tax=Asticcacaulis TaxID=76890 RepID=UPI001AE30E9E|nr:MULTISPECIES: TadE/TadG family type IV pilus assembly protein [Asticcacaulis]MBP2159729.1 Flp pilus assembly protein TadG [Asticcacaulis solisilvae]MDR6800774.1 Flp pilus assembly protein TadG [Asticcacaulis sp. BE141]